MRSRLVLIALAVAAVGTACNDDGRRLADAPPPTPTAPVVSEVTDTSQAFGLTSAAFADTGLIDARFTCDGENVFPPLEVVGIPPAAVELAIVMVDESANQYVHWAVAGIPPTAVALDPLGGLPEAAESGTSDGGVVGWEGPCPPSGDQAHLYRFTVYAFAEPVGLEPGLAGRDAAAVLSATAISRADLTGYYARP